MSPEQAAGAAVDHRTDVYALGVILYEMTSGKVPFDADNFMGILTQHMYKTPVPVRVLVPEANVPPGLDAIVLKCLTKKPEGRYESMDELLADLAKLEQGLSPEAVRELLARSGNFDVPADYFRTPDGMAETDPASMPEPQKRWPLFAGIAVLATCIGLGAVAVLARNASGRSPTVTVPPPAPSAVSGPPAKLAVTATPTEVPAKHEVLVSTAPADATIARDGSPLGQSPVALQLSPGEDAILVITRKGYRTKTVHVDGSGPKVAVTLEPSGKLPAAARSPSPVGIDDVGDPFAKRVAR
jgi:serine/threonine-protein kinase